MTNKILKVGTFFSGIGSPEKALERLKQEEVINDYKVEFFSEIDKDAIKSYCAIHNTSEELNLGDITKIKGKDLPYSDLWIGGFPCQDISCAGKMRGFTFESETRSSLGWEMIRLLKEVEEKPKYVIFENVASITSKKFKDTLDLFKLDLSNMGYTLYDNVLNAVNFEIPQTRRRYFLIAILGKHDKFSFPIGHPTNIKFKDFLDKSKKMYSVYEEKSKCFSNIDIKNPGETEKLIETAINKNEKVEIIYNDFDGSQLKRIIHPLHLFKYKEDYYVTAFCELRNDIRHFEIKRIANIK